MEAGYEIHYINLMASDDLNRDNVDSGKIYHKWRLTYRIC